jgi:hypothetical protein
MVGILSIRLVLPTTAETVSTGMIPPNYAKTAKKAALNAKMTHHVTSAWTPLHSARRASSGMARPPAVCLVVLMIVLSARGPTTVLHAFRDMIL